MAWPPAGGGLFEHHAFVQTGGDGVQRWDIALSPFQSRSLPPFHLYHVWNADRLQLRGPNCPPPPPPPQKLRLLREGAVVVAGRARRAGCALPARAAALDLDFPPAARPAGWLVDRPRTGRHGPARGRTAIAPLCGARTTTGAILSRGSRMEHSMLRGNSEITSRNLEPVGNMTVHSLPSPSRSFCKPAASRPGWPSFRHPFAGRHSHRNRRRNPLRSPAGGGGGCRDPPAAGGAVGHGCAAGAGTAARFRTCRDGLALARAGRGQWLRRPDDGRAAAAGGRGPGRGRLAGLGCGWGPAGLPLRPDRSRRERATQDTLRLPFRCVSMQAGSRLAAVRPTQRLVRPQGVLAVLAVLLAERPRLVFTGRSAGDASMAALAALSLLRPFEWQLINVPMLPRGMAGICMAPIPYVVRHHMRSLSFAVLFCGVCFRPPIELRAGGCSSVDVHRRLGADPTRRSKSAGTTSSPPLTRSGRLAPPV